MHFLIRETLSFNLMYVTACYPVGTTISKTSSLFTALLQHYTGNTRKYQQIDVYIYQYEKSIKNARNNTEIKLRT